jgi:hypothetical protein
VNPALQGPQNWAGLGSSLRHLWLSSAISGISDKVKRQTFYRIHQTGTIQIVRIKSLYRDSLNFVEGDLIVHPIITASVVNWLLRAARRGPGRRRAGLAAVHASDNARKAMDLMYRAGGSTSFKRGSRLAECWRDLPPSPRP